MNRGNPSVLIVDDEVDICRNYADIFTDLGYQVDFAHGGVPALDLVRKRPYDLAVLDLTMPGMDGLTLYREIKKLRAGTLAIIVTGYATSATAEEALAAGAIGVLPKPVDLPKLLELLAQALEQPLVLIVDDDEDLCADLWDLMRERGYRVCVAHDESKAADLLEGREYAVVLIDMKFPTGDGQTVFRLAKRTNPEARTIAITGFRSGTERRVQQLVAEGADAACYKPFDVRALLTTIDRLSGWKG
jgi:two-component system, NtrC family, response regulator HydG